jgi:dTDP-glucose pyrophosphorylase
MKPTLVILAAGISSRYGGLKQLEPVGPNGATIIDYSIYDALRAGFGKVVFVVRPETEAAFRGSFGQRIEKHAPVGYAQQRLDGLPPGFDVPPGRTKPWGTGHAVLAVENLVHEPFAVVNADDFYGASSFMALNTFLQQEEEATAPSYAVVGYSLGNTLTEAGSVNRAVCRCTPDGWLQDIVEIMGIERHGPDGRFTDHLGVEQVIGGDTPVSMNMWGFRPSIFEHLWEAFRRFLQGEGASCEAEFHLPSAVRDLIRNGLAQVRVLPAGDLWSGVTHPQDKARVATLIHELVDRGEYPRELWR